MQQTVYSSHFYDANGNPSGGQSYGTGFCIAWQHGPLVVNDGVRSEPNGCFVETVIAAAIDRLDHYQRSKFASPYNVQAMEHLQRALDVLDQRTKDRQSRGVEGTHAV